MRLYSRTGQTVLNDPEYDKPFEVDANGGFEFPEDLGERVHSFHLGGKPAWETEVERQRRLAQEELDRRRDPATLMNAVQQLVDAAASVAPAAKAEPPAADALAPVAKSPRPRKAPAAPPAE